MPRLAQDSGQWVVGGVDTHKDFHVAAVVDVVGRILGVETFPATQHGYRRLLRWMQSHGSVIGVGVEGCGSWGAGLARHLADEIRPGGGGQPSQPPEASTAREIRSGRRRGAARAVLCGEATVTPKTGTGPVEALRQLRVARSWRHEGSNLGGKPTPQPL